jgi:hypothetical protein
LYHLPARTISTEKKIRDFIVYSIGDNLKTVGGIFQNEKKWQSGYDIVWEDGGSGS